MGASQHGGHTWFGRRDEHKGQILSRPDSGRRCWCRWGRRCCWRSSQSDSRPMPAVATAATVPGNPLSALPVHTHPTVSAVTTTALVPGDALSGVWGLTIASVHNPTTDAVLHAADYTVPSCMSDLAGNAVSPVPNVADTVSDALPTAMPATVSGASGVSHTTRTVYFSGAPGMYAAEYSRAALPAVTARAVSGSSNLTSTTVPAVTTASSVRVATAASLSANAACALSDSLRIALPDVRA